MLATFADCEFDFDVSETMAADTRIEHLRLISRDPFKVAGDYLEVSNLTRARFTSSGKLLNGKVTKSLHLGFIQTLVRSVRSAHYDDTDPGGAPIDFIVYTRINNKRDSGTADLPWYDATNGSALVASGGFAFDITDQPNYAAPLAWRGSRLRELTVDDEFLTVLVAWDRRRAHNKFFYLHQTRWTNSHHVALRGAAYVSLRGVHGHQVVSSDQIPQDMIRRRPGGLTYTGESAQDSEVHSIEYYNRGSPQVVRVRAL